MMISNAVLQRYDELVPEQKDLCLKLQQHTSLDELGTMLDLQPKYVGERILHVSDTLGLPRMASIYAHQQALGEVARLSALKEEEKSPEEQNPPLTADTLVSALLLLDKKYIKVLRVFRRLENLSLGALARRCDIEKQTLYNYLRTIKITLKCDPINDMALRPQVFDAIDRYEQTFGLEPLLTVVEPAKPSIPSPEELYEKIVQLHPKPAAQEATPHPVASGLQPSAGVVIQLPQGVVDIDVVVGTFNGKEPTRNMKAEVQKRKSGRLKPTFLVLTPLDRDTSHAQLVFLEREEKADP